jgi:hypothetical protein
VIFHINFFGKIFLQWFLDHASLKGREIKAASNARACFGRLAENGRHLRKKSEFIRLGDAFTLKQFPFAVRKIIIVNVIQNLYEYE